MGSAFARRLIDANFEVLGIDISADRCEALRETGGSVAGSLSEIGENCDVILMSVMTIAQVEEVMEPDMIKQFVVDEIRKSGDIPNPEAFADMFLGRVSAECYRAE